MVVVKLSLTVACESLSCGIRLMNISDRMIVTGKGGKRREVHMSRSSRKIDAVDR